MPQLITVCPHCATKFRLTLEQLEMADGMVRCGKCINFFNANENGVIADSLGKDGPDAENSDAENAHTVTKEAPDQFEEATQLPAMTELLHNEFGTEQPPLQDKKSKPILAKLLLILAGAILLAAQYSYFFSRELSQTEAYRKPLVSFCHYLDCTVEPFQDIDRLAVKQFMVHSHPSQPGALTVDLIIENRGLFDQPFPKIALRFSDMQNQAVAERRFAASEYLAYNSQNLAAKPKLIPSGKQSRVNFSLLDPGVSAINYSVRLQE